MPVSMFRASTVPAQGETRHNIIASLVSVSVALLYQKVFRYIDNISFCLPIYNCNTYYKNIFTQFRKYVDYLSSITH
jgi:hypothetical protein